MFEDPYRKSKVRLKTPNQAQDWVYDVTRTKLRVARGITYKGSNVKEQVSQGWFYTMIVSVTNCKSSWIFAS